jgi:hypothetical protein
MLKCRFLNLTKAPFQSNLRPLRRGMGWKCQFNRKNDLISTNLPQLGPSPFKGEDRRGMGMLRRQYYPIPTPALHLKGRESLTDENSTNQEKR